MRAVGFAVALGLSTAACGKKGPPLAPLVPIPAAVEAIDAERLGADVYVSLTLPAANMDEYTPADLARVEIYGYTGRSVPPRGRWVELGTLVGTVPVAPPPPRPGEEPKPSSEPAMPLNAPVQGGSIRIRETLTPDELVQGRVPPVAQGTRNEEPGTRKANPEPGTGNVNPEPGTRNANVEPEQLRRFYTALPFSRRGRPGPPGGVAEIPLLPLPDPPPSVDAAYTEKATLVSWEPSGGLIGFLLERALPDEPPPFLEDEDDEPSAPSEPSGGVTYHVYREIVPDPFAPPPPAAEAPWSQEPPRPVTPAPVVTLGFSDTVEFGGRRCYTVRAVRGVGGDARIGEPSPPACVTLVDAFGPTQPQSLAAVASEGAIGLIWEPSPDADLGGYVVLRGEAPGDTLHPLTTAPVADARYRDESVKAGVRYVYAVIAVDNRFPLPNVSEASNRVEEIAR